MVAQAGGVAVSQASEPLCVTGERERGRDRSDQAQTVVAEGGGADLIWAMLGICDPEQGVIEIESIRKMLV